METKNQYAWLEHDNGMWHFIARLFADTAHSTRRWFDEQCALDELTEEGWTIVHSYPYVPTDQRSMNGVYGYGLKRKVSSKGVSRIEYPAIILPIPRFEARE